MSNFHLFNSLNRRIDRLPLLRDRLWSLESKLLERAWRALGRGGPDEASDHGAQLGRTLGTRSRKNQHVLFNLRMAFPNWSRQQIEATAPRIWGSLGRTLMEYSCLGQICDPRQDRIHVVDLGGLAHVRASGRPGIFVAPHLANWNLFPVAAARAGIPLTVVYRRQSNPALEHLMSDWRAALSCGFLEVGEASRGMLRELRAGRSVGLLMDQRYDRGVEVPFFGVPAVTTMVPARLALRLDVPLVPARIERRGNARFVITVYRPLEIDRGLDRESAALDLTMRVNALFASWIQTTPEQWLCVKRRWERPYITLPGGWRVRVA